jgi:hypothetical protein
MKLRIAASLTLALTMMLSSAVAQEEGRGGRGGRGGGGGGFGGGMGMMMGGSGASSILQLLRMEEVRKEVGVADDVWTEIGKNLQEEQRKLFSRDLSADDRKKLATELNTKSQAIMDEILTEEKQTRLKGLYAQQAGGRAVVNEVIAKAIGLSDADKAGLEKELQSQAEKMRESFSGLGGGGGGAPDFAKIQEAMTKANEELNKLIDSKLTAEQKKALEELKGEKFTFPAARGFGGGAGGGAGGRGGRGGASERPRGDGN